MAFKSTFQTSLLTPLSSLSPFERRNELATPQIRFSCRQLFRPWSTRVSGTQIVGSENRRTNEPRGRCTWENRAYLTIAIIWTRCRGHLTEITRSENLDASYYSIICTRYRACIKGVSANKSLRAATIDQEKKRAKPNVVPQKNTSQFVFVDPFAPIVRSVIILYVSCAVIDAAKTKELKNSKWLNEGGASIWPGRRKERIRMFYSIRIVMVLPNAGVEIVSLFFSSPSPLLHSFYTLPALDGALTNTHVSSHSRRYFVLQGEYGT